MVACFHHWCNTAMMFCSDTHNKEVPTRPTSLFNRCRAHPFSHPCPNLFVHQLLHLWSVHHAQITKDVTLGCCYCPSLRYVRARGINQLGTLVLLLLELHTTDYSIVLHIRAKCTLNKVKPIIVIDICFPPSPALLICRIFITDRPEGCFPWNFHTHVRLRSLWTSSS